MRGAWQHLERLGGGRGTVGAGVGTRGPGESQLETDRRLARRRISVLKGRLAEVSRQRATRRKERARTADPDDCARRATRTSGKSTLLNALTDADVSGRGPPLRDARPDDARLRARGTALPRHRHRRLHPPPAASARRGLRLDARGDARRRPRRCTSPMRRNREERARRAAARGRLGAARDRRVVAADAARAQQGRPSSTRSARRRLASALPRRPPDLRADGRGARGAARAHRASISPSASRRCACSSPTTRARGSRSCTALGSPDRGARGRTRGGLRPRATAAPRSRAVRAVHDRRGGAEARVG